MPPLHPRRAAGWGLPARPAPASHHRVTRPRSALPAPLNGTGRLSCPKSFDFWPGSGRDPVAGEGGSPSIACCVGLAMPLGISVYLLLHLLCLLPAHNNPILHGQRGSNTPAGLTAAPTFFQFSLRYLIYHLILFPPNR